MIHIKKFEKIVNKLQNNRIAMIGLGVMAVCLIIFFIVYLKLSANLMKQECLQNMDAKMSQASEDISETFTTMENISSAVFGNDMVQSSLKQEWRYGNYLNEYHTLENFIKTIEYNDMHVSLYIPNEKIYSSDRIHFFPIDEAKDSSWYETVKEKDGRVAWIIGYEGLSNSDGVKVPAISCARLIKSNTDFRKTVGIVKIDIPESDIFEQINSFILEENNSAFILDKTGNVFLIEKTKKSDFNDDELNSYFTEKSGMFERKGSEGKENVIYKYLPDQQWYLTINVPNKDILSYRTVNYIFSIFSMLFILLIIFVILILYGIQNRVINFKIQEMLDKIRADDIKLLAEEKNNTNGTIEDLEIGVENIIYHINKINKEYYDAKYQEEQALLTALQAQINPHFLYNTLDIINWIAINNNDIEVSEAISMLASYFRMSLGNGENIVTIAAEINHIKAYTKIQKLRFQNNIEISYDVENDLLDYCIPKISMQPIIENAIIHGICKNNITDGKIDIAVKKCGDLITVSIKDDGHGTDEDKLNDSIMNNSADTEKHTRSGYGLHNVYRRIKLFSDNDDRCGIKGFSSSDGTIIVMTLKAKQN